MESMKKTGEKENKKLDGRGDNVEKAGKRNKKNGIKQKRN